MDRFGLSDFQMKIEHSLPDQIANSILKKILKGELAPGTRLIESKIAEEWNVSNIPVREAFYILQNTGIVERLPRKGVRVKSFTQRELDEYTVVLIELFKAGLEYSKPHWSTARYEELSKLLNDAKQKIAETDIFHYVLVVHRICEYILMTSKNSAFVKVFNDITFITNAYSQMMWQDVEKTKSRLPHLELLVESIINSDFERAKEEFEILTRTSLSL